MRRLAVPAFSVPAFAQSDMNAPPADQQHQQQQSHARDQQQPFSHQLGDLHTSAHWQTPRHGWSGKPLLTYFRRPVQMDVFATSSFRQPKFLKQAQ